MVEPGSELAEGVAALGLRVLVDPEQRGATEQPDDVVERAGVLVEHGLGVEETLIPSGAASEVAHGDSDVGNAGKRSHRASFLPKVCRGYVSRSGTLSSWTREPSGGRTPYARCHARTDESGRPASSLA